MGRISAGPKYGPNLLNLAHALSPETILGKADMGESLSAKVREYVTEKVGEYVRELLSECDKVGERVGERGCRQRYSPISPKLLLYRRQALLPPLSPTRLSALKLLLYRRPSAASVSTKLLL